MRKRLVWVGKKNGGWVSPDQVRRVEPNKSDMPMPMVMRPLTERVSPIDGSVISSRGELKEHNQRNNVVDVGDEVLEPNVPKPTKRDYKDSVGEAYRKVASGYAPEVQEADTLEGEAVETKIIGTV